jgi:probable phosphoglycerate mutase
VLVLVRHGESTGNAEGRLLGRIDAPLTEDGLAQARAAGELLALGPRVLELRSSPLQRALRTAEALDTGRAVEVDERWVEVDYGEHDGSLLGDVPAEVWQQWRSDPDFRPPGGESLAAVGARVAAACDELFAHPDQGARASDGDVVVVSHVSPIKAAVAWALGAGPGLDFRLRLSTGSLTRIGWGPAGPVLHSFNEVPSPSGEVASAPSNMRP